MLEKYTFWMHKDGSQGTLSGGESIPVFGNGTPMFKLCEVDKVYVIQAETPEEASAIHNLRQGYSPYYPMGEAQKCPRCDAGHYYLGSGKCHCGYSYDSD